MLRATDTYGRKFLLAGLCAAALAMGATPAAAAPKPAGSNPNLIVITTDDQTLESMNRRTMPFTSKFFADRGTEFSNAVVVSPSCCPSRAAFVTGQYPHNNGVFSNHPGYGALVGKGNTLPVWIRRAGYRTAHVGKFLNHYGSVRGPKNPAPGFDSWFTQVGYKYYGYKIATPGKLRQGGERPRDYLTRVYNRKAERLVRQRTGSRRPLYLQLDHFAPHSESGSTPGSCAGAAQPDPADADLFADEPLPQLSLDPAERSYNEEDVSDKSSVPAGFRSLSNFVLGKVQRRYRCQLAALRAVDRGFQRIFRGLLETRALRRTAIVFTSDNGFFHAEHRIPNNKGFPYEEGIRVPLLVSLPPALNPDPPERIDEPVANIDITATLNELAGAEPCNRRGRCRQLDGRSLMGLLLGDGPTWPEERPILVEQDRRQYFCAPFAAVWTPQTMLAEYSVKEPTGGCSIEHEYYEMDADPMQLENLYPATPGTQRASRQSELIKGLEELRRCAGISGRDAGEPGRPFCS